jgi:hypothetical protein
MKSTGWADLVDHLGSLGNGPNCKLCMNEYSEIALPLKCECMIFTNRDKETNDWLLLTPSLIIFLNEIFHYVINLIIFNFIFLIISNKSWLKSETFL